MTTLWGSLFMSRVFIGSQNAVCNSSHRISHVDLALWVNCRLTEICIHGNSCTTVSSYPVLQDVLSVIVLIVKLVAHASLFIAITSLNQLYLATSPPLHSRVVCAVSL